MESKLEIRESNVSFETVYQSDYAPKDEKFRQANCLIIPYENFRSGVDYCFSEYAQEVLEYSRDNPDLKMDIAATDDNYKVIELHSLLLQIGIFVATSIVLPVVVNVVSNFVYDKIKELHRKKDDVEVSVTFISVNADGTSKQISYDGPVDKLETVINKVKELPTGRNDESWQ